MFISVVKSDEVLEVCSDLVARKYAEQGYPGEVIPGHCVTFMLSEVVGTLSLTFDGSGPMCCEAVYQSVLEGLRAGGAQLCELVRFASNRIIKRAEFDALWKFLTKYQSDRTDLLIEVHPRHRGFYKRGFGFEELASNWNANMGCKSFLLRKRLVNVT